MRLQSLSISESISDIIFYHGSTDMHMHGKNGIHIGSKLAATQALQARIGIPAIGEWDGTREYGKTLLAGKNTIERKIEELGYYCDTGFNCGPDVPLNDYYPIQRSYRAVYSDGSLISFNSKPIVFAVVIIGDMINSINRPYTDRRANSAILKDLRSGNAVGGYFYTNISEDEGSISAVVPNSSYLRII